VARRRALFPYDPRVTEALQVVWFERRSGLWLGAVKGEGNKKLGLTDEGGQSRRIPRKRVLASLETRLESEGDSALGARLRALREGWQEPEAPGEEQLWGLLDEEELTSLADLAQRCFGRAGDAELAAVTRGLVDETGRMHPSIRLRDGGLVRLSASARERALNSAAEAEAAARARDALLSWWSGGADEAPEEAQPALELLRGFALSGAQGPYKGGARLAKQLGFEDADALLTALEHRGIVERDANELIARRGLPAEFPPKALSEAAEIAAAELDPRGEDLRARPTVAIDTPGSEEIDDAFSLWEEEGVTYLAVHVARPADWIGLDSALDVEALERATSVYFPEQTLPMLPEAVVERCGLLPGQPREALSLILPIEEGVLGAGRFARTRVVVDAHLDYEEAHDHPLAGELLRELEPALERAHAQRVALGAFHLRTPNVKIELDEAGEPRPRLLSDGRAQQAVAELMVLYNARLGDALSAAGAPAPYRVQPEPVALREATDDPIRIMAARRELPPTRVQTTPGPQLSMGLSAYVQASSPLRRYLDLVAQRQLLAHLAGEPWPYPAKSLNQLLKDVHGRERRARGAEEERLRYYLCRWLERMGPDVAIPGLISRSSRPMVFLPAWQRELPLRARRGEELRLGEEVQVSVDSVEPRARRARLRL